MKNISRKLPFQFLLACLFLQSGTLWAQETSAIDSGATAWMLTSTALVLLMIPGLAMFYGGLVRTKNVLGTMMHSFSAMGIMTVLWVICGYAMCFGPSILGGWFGWDSGKILLDSLDQSILAAGVPEYVFSMFQGKFAIITPALIAGAFAERVTFKGYCIFIALWGLLVYNPSAIGYGQRMASFSIWVQMAPLILPVGQSFIFRPGSAAWSPPSISVHVVATQKQ